MMRRFLSAILCLIVMFKLSACQVQSAADCIYVPADSSRDDVIRFENCAHISATGELHIDAVYLQRMQFVDHALAQVWVDKQVFYVNQQGRSASMLVFDNGPDYFVEGLARSFYRGKVGFVDRQLNQVIPARYDFAFPFQNGLAKVCMACKQVAEGEHHRLEGGHWGYIDRTGKEVVMLKYRLENLPAVEAR